MPDHIPSPTPSPCGVLRFPPAGPCRFVLFMYTGRVVRPAWRGTFHDDRACPGLRGTKRDRVCGGRSPM